MAMSCRCRCHNMRPSVRHHLHADTPTQFAKMGDLGTVVLPPLPTGVVWTRGQTAVAKWSVRANHGAWTLPATALLPPLLLLLVLLLPLLLLLLLRVVVFVVVQRQVQRHVPCQPWLLLLRRPPPSHL